tara:strand:+ start:3013 stop:4692 length:1680 start_codon:yes stop_codon:yes gene_type:complete
MNSVKLRPWQAKAITKCKNWFLVDKNKRFLINAAPGSGKTICATVIAKELIEKKVIERVIVIAPTKEVVKQWADEFKFVTGRHMTKITGSNQGFEDYGVDLCATWQSIQGLLDGFQAICKKFKTVVICDEHHHAAVEAVWGEGAFGAFNEATYSIILTGTPIRSDGKDTVWFETGRHNTIEHPEEGSFTLTYGEAVDLEYCRPITFHRHEGHFKVDFMDGTSVDVSGTKKTKISGNFKRIKALDKAIEFYRLARIPKYLDDNITPDLNSYQASMIEAANEKLEKARKRLPTAGGLVIAPNIETAEYMSKIIEMKYNEKPILVHSEKPNASNLIQIYKNSDRKWLVSVAMVSEGVDIKRLRVLVYLPPAETELFFRQAMGRVVRSYGPKDDSRAYVVMPTHLIFEEYARRVEREMSPSKRKEGSGPKTKLCPSCQTENSLNAKVCCNETCGHEFSDGNISYKKCEACDHLNPISASECEHCGERFDSHFVISLDNALRHGVIVRGMDIDESEATKSEINADSFREAILLSGDEVLIKMLRLLPDESHSRLSKITNEIYRN